MQPTTITSWALLLTKVLESRGIDSAEVLIEVGLDPAELTQAGARYPFARMTRLWQRAVELTGDDCIGLKAAKYWHPTTAHALGYAWLASDTLKDALLRLQRYAHIMNDVTRAILTEEAQHYVLTLDVESQDLKPAPEAIDAGFATIVHMCRVSMGNEFHPLRVELRRETPACVEEFNKFFEAPVQFQTDQNAVYLDKKSIEEQLPTSNKQLALTNEKIIIDYLAQLDASDISLSVKKILMEKLSDGAVSAESVANALHQSPRTFQRRLKEQQTSFSKLMEETRKEIATAYIESSNRSVTEITYLLGFAETSTFSRAFKRWTGKSPTEYRRAS